MLPNRLGDSRLGYLRGFAHHQHMLYLQYNDDSISSLLHLLFLLDLLHEYCTDIRLHGSS